MAVAYYRYYIGEKYLEESVLRNQRYEEDSEISLDGVAIDVLLVENVYISLSTFVTIYFN